MGLLRRPSSELSVVVVGEVGGGGVVVGFVAGPALCVGAAGFGFADLVDELAWPAFVEDVEGAGPVGDVEGLDELGGAVGENCGAPKVGEGDGSGDGVVGGFGSGFRRASSPRGCFVGGVGRR